MEPAPSLKNTEADISSNPMVEQSHVRWVYFLPILHLCACFASLIGFVIPSLQYWGIAWTFILILDLPDFACILCAGVETRYACRDLDFPCRDLLVVPAKPFSGTFD
jgi:hypothetical protein